jgi:molybdopterin molybdotransferase
LTSPREQREFFAVRTVGEALTGFRPARRTGTERVTLEDALGRVPADPVPAPHPLPGFARATVDGFAVRAADTYGVSDGQPGYLDLTGEARMGRPPDAALRPGAAIAIATGAPLPPGADAVVKIEHTQSTMAGLIEVVRTATPGEGMVRADEDASTGGELARPGRPLRAADLGMLAAAGVTDVLVCARPRVAIVSTGDELVPRETAELEIGQVRDATAPALAALVREAGGEPSFAGIVPDERDALEAALHRALAGGEAAAAEAGSGGAPAGSRDAAAGSGGAPAGSGDAAAGSGGPPAGSGDAATEASEAAAGSCDLLVVSAGSSVGARDETASAVASLGEPGIWCHGLALRPGKPTLLADCGGVPVIGLPGNPRSALVVFRLVGMPLVRLVGGCTDPPPEPTVRARLGRDLPSAAGRLDVVQVSLDGDVATPLFGSSSLLSILARADGHLVVPEAATGLPAGAEVEVTLYR